MSVDTPPLPRNKSVGNISEDELNTVKTEIIHHVKDRLGVSVNSIFVTGSFARGEAMAVASDLDLRIVVDDVPNKTDIDDFEEWLKNKHGSRIVPELCGFVDGRIANKPPDENEAHFEL